MIRYHATGILLTCCFANAAMAAESAASTPPGATVTPLFAKTLADVPGKESALVMVEYAPGAATPAHEHATAHTLVYVLEGALEMQVAGGRVTIVRQGETFYEAPGDVHVVSRNASDVERARFLVYFLRDAGAPLLTPREP